MNLFNYLVDGVTYSKAEYEAHVRADEEAADEAAWFVESQAELDAERRYEQMLENTGFEEARAQEAYEAARGIFA